LYAVLNVCFHLCAANPLPSQGRGRGGVSVNLVHERFVSHPCTPALRWDYSLYTSEIIGLEGQQQLAQGNALGTMVVCY